jgi:hypothetical protein
MNLLQQEGERGLPRRTSRASSRAAWVCAALLVGAMGCGDTSGGNGGTGGSNGAGGTTAAGGASGSTGAGGSQGGAGGGGVNCVAGASCTGSATCAAPCAGGTREIACFCETNGLLACETCAASTDGGVPACPTNPMAMTCSTVDSTCQTACTNGMSQSCRCLGNLTGTMDTWRCQSVRCQ